MIRRIDRPGGPYQTYPDGWGSVYTVKDRKITGVRQGTVHFADSVVGERRFWDAQVLGVRIDRAILVPAATNVETDDLFMIDGRQYEVKQKQLYTKTQPESWLLSLSETLIRYKGGEGNGQGGH